MPITVTIEDEDGVQLGAPWQHESSSAALDNADEDTSCLKFIDPYGETVFNQLQIPVLIIELMNHVLDSPSTDHESVIRDLVRFVRGAQDRVHVYVRFSGD